MLTLPIKKKWYDMILAGIKKEEYREIRYYGGRFPQEKYAGYQGVMQQYLFAYIRNTEK